MQRSVTWFANNGSLRKTLFYFFFRFEQRISDWIELFRRFAFQPQWLDTRYLDFFEELLPTQKRSVCSKRGQWFGIGQRGPRRFIRRSLLERQRKGLRPFIRRLCAGSRCFSLCRRGAFVCCR